MVSTLGSCACFCLSLLIGKAVAQALWPERLETFADEVRAFVPLFLGGMGCASALCWHAVTYQQLWMRQLQCLNYGSVALI